jgi:hypothetical protein
MQLSNGFSAADCRVARQQKFFREIECGVHEPRLCVYSDLRFHDLLPRDTLALDLPVESA